MRLSRSAVGFKEWREAARELLSAGVDPGGVDWNNEQPSLFAATERVIGERCSAVSMPRNFVKAAEVAACHSDPARWSLLYRIAWRILRENRQLMHIEVDDDVRALMLMQKSVAKDMHQMRAFVRFRRVEGESGEEFIAWYRPDHHILERNSKFFVDRFGAMRWAILTPEASLFWDRKELRFGPGVPRSAAPAEDELDDLWRTYYKSIFNPARLNLTVMRAQLPVRRWENLPESRTIAEAARGVRGRLQEMVNAQPRSASDFIPVSRDLSDLRTAIGGCQACGLCSLATQPVFGEGPQQARIVLVGEQPGDAEDRAGRPFVGPAGAVLDEAMRQAGLNRSDVYLTNAVKAFRFLERGKRRLHQNPRSYDIATCRPWLEAEMEAINPAVIVCLGGSASQSVLGRSVRVTDERGQLQPHLRARAVVVTYHPSAALRVQEAEASRQIRDLIAQDLALAKATAA